MRFLEIVLLLKIALFCGFFLPSHPALLEQPAPDPVTEALVDYVSVYSTPEGQLAAGLELLNSNIFTASTAFYNETNVLDEELSQAIELIGNAVIAVLDDEIYQRQYRISDLRLEIQELVLQLNDAIGTCALYSGCLTCTQDQGCVWCRGLGRCVTGDQLGAYNNDCQDFVYEQCPNFSCPEYDTCLECASDASCAWCESTGDCAAADTILCDEAFLISTADGQSCPITSAQVLSSYSAQLPLNVPDSRVNSLQSQLVSLEQDTAELRDQVNQLQSSRAQIVRAQTQAESIVASGNYTFEQLTGLADSVESQAQAEGK